MLANGCVDTFFLRSVRLYTFLVYLAFFDVVSSVVDVLLVTRDDARLPDLDKMLLDAGQSVAKIMCFGIKSKCLVFACVSCKASSARPSQTRIPDNYLTQTMDLSGLLKLLILHSNRFRLQVRYIIPETTFDTSQYAPTKNHNIMDS